MRNLCLSVFFYILNYSLGLMKYFPVFVSLVITLRNQSDEMANIISNAVDHLSSLVLDYEIIIIENASDDNSIEVLKKLTGANGFPNLQVYALTKAVNEDTAAWVGVENALGDFVVVFNPMLEDLVVLPQILEMAVSGSDVVLVHNKIKASQSLSYRFAGFIFNNLYKCLNGIDLIKDAPQYRVLSKRVINFILQHNQPVIGYRHLPITSGFLRSNISYSSKHKYHSPKKLTESIERGIKLIVSTTSIPMRLVTFLSLFGAGANVFYSFYVVIIGFFADDIAPGWISISLQISGMFFLISLVLFVLGEYILHTTSLTNQGPEYYVSQEFTSERITRRERLNIEESMLKRIDDAS